MVNEQMGLPLERPRVRLDDGERALRPRKRLEDPPAMTLGEEVAEDLGRADALGVGLTFEDALGLTPWSTDFPPCAGYWQVTDHKTGTLRDLWWFDAVPAMWRKRPDVGTAAAAADCLPGATHYQWSLTHDEFRDLYAWRGLAVPHPHGYPCPPYDADKLGLRARELGVPAVEVVIADVRGTFHGARPRNRL